MKPCIQYNICETIQYNIRDTIQYNIRETIQYNIVYIQFKKDTENEIDRHAAVLILPRQTTTTQSQRNQTHH